jgi:hypothetical protein
MVVPLASITKRPFAEEPRCITTISATMDNTQRVALASAARYNQWAPSFRLSVLSSIVMLLLNPASAEEEAPIPNHDVFFSVGNRASSTAMPG